VLSKMQEETREVNEMNNTFTTSQQETWVGYPHQEDGMVQLDCDPDVPELQIYQTHPPISVQTTLIRASWTWEYDVKTECWILTGALGLGIWTVVSA
jgi:hypothetical protein